ncbi:MAG: hypothetical protein A2076_06625 [Geobacteraceae bacterium GWC2_53_11]|nr:MAG: hypothetical protein A2076_06625 [Geobacteraceae bacterium GWC2_53_11]
MDIVAQENLGGIISELENIMSYTCSPVGADPVYCVSRSAAFAMLLADGVPETFKLLSKDINANGEVNNGMVSTGSTEWYEFTTEAIDLFSYDNFVHFCLAQSKFVSDNRLMTPYAELLDAINIDVRPLTPGGFKNEIVAKVVSAEFDQFIAVIKETFVETNETYMYRILTEIGLDELSFHCSHLNDLVTHARDLVLESEDALEYFKNVQPRYTSYYEHKLELERRFYKAVTAYVLKEGVAI